MKEGEMSGGSSPTKNKLAILLLLLFFFLLPVGAGAGAHDGGGDDECKPRRCGKKGPDIRFPFWLKDRQPDHCGYGSAFALTCSPKNEILVDNPFSVKLVVKHIDYRSQNMRYVLSGCVPPQKNLSSAFTYPFYEIWDLNSVYEYPVFSCPSSIPYDELQSYDVETPLPCLSNPGHNLYLLNSYTSIRQTLRNCTKMNTVKFQGYNVKIQGFIDKFQGFIDTSDRILKYYIDSYGTRDPLSGTAFWDRPNCTQCEEISKYCRLNSTNNSEKHETECFDKPTRGDHTKSQLVKGLISPGIFLLVIVVISAYFAHRSNILKKEDQVKVERFLEDYRALKPTRYTYAEIKKITHNLKEKLGQGGYGTVFKGELSNDVPIAVKILDNFAGKGDDFINEVGTIGTIHHVNVVRLVGYCADGYKKALVYEYLPNDSLEKFISSDDKKASLGWAKLQDIAIGIAKGIEYLHQGCDQRILHFDIKPHNILLDKNFIPKISDFGLAKLCSKDQSAVSMTAAPRGTAGYIAPEVFSRNFGNVSHKSDVYSFGMLLLEMVGGRKKQIDFRKEEKNDEVYFPEWIYNRLNREEVNNNGVEEGGDAMIVKKLTVVGLWCIQWYPGDWPSMKAAVQMLEGDGETLVMPPNPFSTTNGPITKGKMGERPFSSILEIISESD